VGPEEVHKNDLRDGTPLLSRKAQRVGAVQLVEEKALGDLIAAFQCLKVACKKAGEELFTMP